MRRYVHRKADKKNRWQNILPSVICLLFSSYFALHFIERRDELRKILGIEHNRRLLSSAGLLGNLEKLAIAALLEVDIERPLATVDRHGVDLVCEASSGTGSAGRAWCCWRWLIIAEPAAGTGKFRHRIEHIKG